MQPIDLDNEFVHHPPRNEHEVAEHQAIRDAGKTLAQMLDDVVPDGPHKSLAIRKVQEAVMWGNAGLACNRGQATGGGDDRSPHSRACGITPHGHGTACSRDCPTCGGRA